ncbi:MAG TPA: hypothetical protein VIK75_03435 [Calditerricola sp.]
MTFQVWDLILIPVIMGIVGLLRLFGLSAHWAPIAAVVLGLIAGFLYLAPGDALAAIVLGALYGVSAIGLHSGIKNTWQAICRGFR